MELAWKVALQRRGVSIKTGSVDITITERPHPLRAKLRVCERDSNS
jgi:hypothetical protein